MNREKLNLTKLEGRDLVYGDLLGYKKIEKEFVGKSRWCDEYELVVKREVDGKFFKGGYRIGSTESCEERPFEYDEPDFTEVFPIEKKVIVYE